ncbi:unnamed protein product [Ambrosiozyma monospora]|uniref:Unnamed protein product n=1 Tax=Ambrosiozyma monospora TaxID=43982 RepID=A0A9W6YX82_AMBMO|nr:unnamed protein product [Ambrosiozyma monospora]
MSNIDEMTMNIDTTSNNNKGMLINYPSGAFNTLLTPVSAIGQIDSDIELASRPQSPSKPVVANDDIMIDDDDMIHNNDRDGDLVLEEDHISAPVPFTTSLNSSAATSAPLSISVNAPQVSAPIQTSIPTPNQTEVAPPNSNSTVYVEEVEQEPIDDDKDEDSELEYESEEVEIEVVRTSMGEDNGGITVPNIQDKKTEEDDNVVDIPAGEAISTDDAVETAKTDDTKNVATTSSNREVVPIDDDFPELFDDADYIKIPKDIEIQAMVSASEKTKTDTDAKFVTDNDVRGEIGTLSKSATPKTTQDDNKVILIESENEEELNSTHTTSVATSKNGTSHEVISDDEIQVVGSNEKQLELHTEIPLYIDLISAFYKLYKPTITEDADFESLPVLFDDAKEMLQSSLHRLIQLIKFKMNPEELGELVLIFKDLDNLRIAEDDLTGKDILLNDIVELFVSLRQNSASGEFHRFISCEVEVKPAKDRFVNMFRSLINCYHMGKGLDDLDELESPGVAVDAVQSTIAVVGS